MPPPHPPAPTSAGLQTPANWVPLPACGQRLLGLPSAPLAPGRPAGEGLLATLIYQFLVCPGSTQQRDQ